MTDLSHGRGWLDAAAAASLRRIDAELGHPLDINEAGRTWAQQDDFYQTYLRVGWPIALSPDAPSIHQLGRAIDTDEQNTPVLNRHGWFHTVYRNGVLVEPWHYEYDAANDQHRNTTPATPATRTHQEDEMPATFINIQGKAGSHRGGTFAIMRDNAGKLFARFVSPSVTPGVPTVPSEEYAAWANTMPIK